MIGKVKAFVELARVKHWIKNLLVFLPAICAYRLDNWHTALVLCLGFLAFSLLTSFVYIINDLRDVEKDRTHPRKKKRPLPSGRVSKNEAIIAAGVTLALSVGLELLATQNLFSSASVFLLIYAVINLGYSFGLKNIAILDVVILAAGYLLRIYYGAALVDVETSHWLFLTILSASTFLSLGKRRKEMGVGGRKVLDEYNAEFLDRFMTVFVTLTFIFYALWASDQNNDCLLLTIPVVMIIFMRYCLDIEKTDEGDPTTVIYSDKVLIMLCLLYVILMGVFFFAVS